MGQLPISTQKMKTIHICNVSSTVLHRPSITACNEMEYCIKADVFVEGRISDSKKCKSYHGNLLIRFTAKLFQETTF